MPEKTDPLWFKDAIIYELHLKAFFDSNADGMGDLGGLMEKLDYLQDLGVTAVWLLPFYPSPQRDGGYDISDYYRINSDYGNIKQFKKLMKMAHKRGLRVITELVINHTSDQHPWFQRARRARPGSKYRDYYVWSNTTERYKDVRIIFQDFEKSNWTWDSVGEAYYWHRFYSHQPDLNYDNPAVREEIFRIIDFWIDMGVDGFRLDAIPYLFEREGTNCENLPETHRFLKELRAHVDRKRKDVLLLAEANMWPEDSASYFGDGDECHMNYHFPIMPRMFMALKMEDRYPIIDIIDQTPEIPENCQWGIFLRNHDELTLEMVTDEERDYMYRAYNKDAMSRINLGIRHRLAPLLDNNRQKIELMNCLLFCLPGTPVIYYGDEIGMGDNVHLGDRDGVRTPMQWSLDRNAGFSRAHPQKLYLPLINDPEYHHASVNVEVQQKNPSSLLWWTKRMIAVRKRYQAFGRGDIRFLSPENAKVLAFTRSYQDEHLLVLANLSRHPQVVDLELPDFERYTPIDVFGQSHFPAIERGLNRFMLGPYGYYWFLLEPEQAGADDTLAPISVAWEPHRWRQLAREEGQTLLTEKILPSYLKRNDAYTINDRVLDRAELYRLRSVSYDGGHALLLIVKAFFTEGFPEWLFIPVTFAEGGPRQHPDAPGPESILAILEGENHRGYLYEATHSPAFRNYLLLSMLNGNGRSTQGFRFVRSGPKVKLEDIPMPRELETSGNNLPLAFGDQYFLKIFRHLEESPNPDLEINRLGNGNGLPVPGYLGHFQNHADQHSPFILAMLQPYVPNQGSAWQYFYDVSSRYLERIQARPEQIELPEPPRQGDTPHNGDWEGLIGGMPPVRAALLGETVARFHSGMLNREKPDFEPEDFSLHYQRSLYSAWQSQARATFQQLRRRKTPLPSQDLLQEKRRELNARLRRIYDHKIDAPKVRIHGDLHLEKVLFTGREFCLFDFEGDRIKSFSELRLRKSPARDLSSLISSLYYAAVAPLCNETGIEAFQESEWLPWAEAWYDHMSGAFLNGYLPIARAAGLIPVATDDWHVLLDTFLLERHLYELDYEMRRGRNWEVIPLRALLRMLGAH